MPRPPKFLNSSYDSYPDDNSDKEVYVEAAGLTYNEYQDRHVLLRWFNRTPQALNDNGIMQLIQLTEQAGNYAYYSPVAKIRSLESGTANKTWLLGTYTRAQRDEILRLAEEV
jgi:hypothetical protein